MAEGAGNPDSESGVLPPEVFVHRRRTRAGQHEPDTLDFEIEKCIRWINSVGNVVIGLQFPEEFLPYATAVARIIESRIHREVYVLADTTDAECCVDELTASHLGIEAIIHFGHACLTCVYSAIPVYYVFLESSFDVDLTANRIKEAVPESLAVHLLVTYDTRFTKFACKVALRLSEIGCRPTLSRLATSEEIGQIEVRRSGRIIPNYILRNFSLERSHTIHIGDKDSVFLRNWILSFPVNAHKQKCFCYDPLSDELTTSKYSDWYGDLKKRMHVIDRIKTAETFGVLCGSLVIKHQDRILERIKAVLTACGKKFFVYTVTKLNPAKLANFRDIDAFVLLSCGETCIVKNPKDYHKPIATPYEMELALMPAGRDITEGLISDFSELLEGGPKYVPIRQRRATGEGEDEAQGSSEEGASGVSVVSSHSIASPSSSGSPMSPPLGILSVYPNGATGYSWNGLSFHGPNPGAESVEPQEGLSGLPSGYRSEPVGSTMEEAQSGNSADGEDSGDALSDVD